MGHTRCYVCNTMPQIEWLVTQLHAQPEWSYDLETIGTSFLTGEIICASFSWAHGMGACIAFRSFSTEEQNRIWELLRKVFSNKSKKITQNGTYDIKFLWKRGIALLNWYADTILEHHLLDENATHHGLEYLAKDFTSMGGYHNELDEFVAAHPEADPSMCQVEGDDKWKKAKVAERAGAVITARGSFGVIPTELLYPYACGDADATLRVHRVLFPRLKAEGLLWLFHNVQMPTQKILSRVEYSGVTVDREYNAQLRAEYAQKIHDAWETIRNTPEVQAVEFARQEALKAEWASKKKNKKSLTPAEYLEKHRAAWEFRLSTKYLGELFIGQLGMEPLKTGAVNAKTGIPNVSMDKEVLAEYAKKLPMARQVMDYRQLVTLNGTFIDGLSHFIHEDGRIRSNYPLFRTVTGRPSSFQPNLNNIPRKRVEIKYQFTADPGEWMIEGDLSQAEFRIWASESQDPQMIADINGGLDIHKITAAMGKGLIIPAGEITYDQFLKWTAEITKEERNIAKTVVFGMMYGRGPRAIAIELGITFAQAKRIIQLFFGRYPIARQWLRDTVEYAKRTGMVINAYGRRRRLPILLTAEKQADALKAAFNDQQAALGRREYVPEDELIDEEWMKDEVFGIMSRRAKAERQAINSPIQGGASDTNFLAAARIDRAMTAGRLHTRARMILTVYDSLLYTVKPEVLDTMLRIVHTEMLRETDRIKVRLNCEIKIGRVWGKLEEVPFSVDHVPDYTNVKILQTA